MTKRFIIALGVVVVLGGIIAFLRLTPAGASFIWAVTQGGTFLLPLVTFAALLDSINPCAFSVLLLTIAFLFSLGKARTHIMKIGGMYIFGIFAAYILIGLGIAHALHFFNIPNFMGRVGAILLVALGIINIAGALFPRFPVRLGIPQAAHRKMATLMEKVSLPAAFFLGGLVGLCEFPCTGGPYLMVIGMLHDRSTYGAGLGYLFLYNVIFVLPLAAILFFASNVGMTEKVDLWQRTRRKEMKLWGGVVMVVLGIAIFFL
ncbi:MAG: cytochrome c biogenesis protein CcdA [Patescibacteria group bacterium]